MKKRLVVVLSLLLAVILLAGCGSAVKIGSFSSEYYNSDEFQAAVDEVMDYFKNFEGCTMKEIKYAGDDVVKAEAEARGLSSDTVIVLESTFTTDGENHKNGLEPNYTYEHFQWILTRDSSLEPFWVVADHGYG